MSPTQHFMVQKGFYILTTFAGKDCECKFLAVPCYSLPLPAMNKRATFDNLTKLKKQREVHLLYSNNPCC